MKKTKLLITLALVAITFWGCSEDEDEDKNKNGGGTPVVTEVEGQWIGTEVGATDAGNWTFDFSGNIVKVIDAVSQEWYNGTFTLNSDAALKQTDIVITEAPAFVGATALGIYKIDGTTMTFAGTFPGSTIRPTEFKRVVQSDGNLTRLFTLTKQ